MKKILFLILAALFFTNVFLYYSRKGEGRIEQSDRLEADVQELIGLETEYFEKNGIDVLVEGKSISSFGYDIEMKKDTGIYVPENFMEDVMGCSVNVYKDGSVEVDRAETELKFSADEAEMKQKDEKTKEVYVPVSDHIQELGYKMEYSFGDGHVNFINTDNGANLPRAYDMREHDRVTPVRDQGEYGTCWAFASLGALETITMPAEEDIYSVDHLSKNNGYSLSLSEGGEHIMSIAYMSAWKGPVYEKDDPYGDGQTNTELAPVKHLEEAIIIDERDDEKIKSAIYKYGGIETSIYMEMPYGDTQSPYYDSETYSYYYDGNEKPTHDLVIVGWDDDYPKEKFKNEPLSNGAYICKNSWGEGFGDKGYFYVSYEDKNICSKSIVYTKLADTDNYDNIYQADLLGWVGQMGYGSESAYFANVYTAEKDETLEAVSFYATGKDTTFKVFIVTDFKDISSLNGGRKEIGKGETRYSGYYTVDLNQKIDLNKGQKYAIIMSIKTPGSDRPIAIECDAGARTKDLDLTDGEGYVSNYGESWKSAEESEANICLKAFTNDR